jgi:3-methyl-2-oxobutanoate hydroxymethyltransferase
VFMLVLECIPDRLAQRITKQMLIPTIGVGAGPNCDGQRLVFHDLVGLFERFTPKFAKQYVVLSPLIKKALTEFKEEIENGSFPSPEHTFSMPKQEETNSTT